MGKPKKYLGPSQFACALELSPYQTSQQLKKILEVGDDTPRNYYTKFGINKEGVVRNLYSKVKHVNVKSANFITDVLCPRLGGISDGLIGKNGGLEIKCHVLEKNFCEEIPTHYLVQVVGYMFLYGRKWWDFMSCFFENDEVKKYKIIRVKWEDYEGIWFNNWYDKIVKYAESVAWNTTL